MTGVDDVWDTSRPPLIAAPGARERSPVRPLQAAPGTAVDTAAFAALYEEHHQALYRYCRSILRNEADAWDVLQSTMLKALTALQGEERSIELRPWLFRIAHNETISLLRARRPTIELETVADVLGRDGLHENVLDRERLAHLYRDLLDLPERQRSALILRELSGLGHEEIAAVLGCSTASAKQSIFEARSALHACAEGRAMECEAVQRTLSDADGRVLRSRRLRAHVRNCESCRRFQGDIARRPTDLAMLAPALPLAASAALLGHLAPGVKLAAAAHGSAAGAGGAAAAATATGGAAGVLSVAKVAIVAGVLGVAAVGGTLVVSHLPGHAAPRVSRQAPPLKHHGQKDASTVSGAGSASRAAAGFATGTPQRSGSASGRASLAAGARPPSVLPASAVHSRAPGESAAAVGAHGSHARAAHRSHGHNAKPGLRGHPRSSKQGSHRTHTAPTATAPPNAAKHHASKPAHANANASTSRHTGAAAPTQGSTAATSPASTGASGPARGGANAPPAASSSHSVSATHSAK
jgi:RNA polymerase sigma factor (sigma-70 family)